MFLAQHFCFIPSTKNTHKVFQYRQEIAAKNSVMVGRVMTKGGPLNSVGLKIMKLYIDTYKDVLLYTTKY